MKKIALIGVLIIFGNTAGAQEFSKEKWIHTMKTEFHIYFCPSKNYSRQCFTGVQESQCRMVATDASSACLKKIEGNIPASLNRTDDEYWGKQLESCVQKAYEFSFLKQKINTAKCNNPSNWR